MTEVVSASFGIFAAGIQWFQALSPRLRNDAKELASTLGDTWSCCVLIPRTETVPAHVGLGDLGRVRTIGGPIAGAAVLLRFPETDLATVVQLDDGRWWCCAKVANMLVPGADAIHPTLQDALGFLEEAQRTAQAPLTLVVDPALDIEGWPARQPLQRLAEVAMTRGLARLQHLAAPARIARVAIAAVVGLVVLPGVVGAGIIGFRGANDGSALVAVVPVSADAPRPSEVVQVCYDAFARLLYQDGWEPSAFECVLDPSAKRELAGKDRAWTGAYVAARFTQHGGTATALRDWAKGMAVDLNKGAAIVSLRLDLDDVPARGPEALLNVGLAEARLLDTGTRLSEPLEVRRRGRTRIEFDVSSQVPARHWGRVLSLPGVRITRIGVAVSGTRIQWTVTGDVDAL